MREARALVVNPRDDPEFLEAAEHAIVRGADSRSPRQLSVIATPKPSSDRET